MRRDAENAILNSRRPAPTSVAVEWYRDLAATARALVDVARLPRPVCSDAARGAVQARLADREGRFLRLFESAVVRNANSPYRRLLSMAGCEMEDVAGLVRGEGLDAALRELIEAGVYVTFDEFKGRSEVKRGSWRAWFREADFDNPVARRSGCFLEFSSGSGGRPSRVRRPVRLEQENALHYRLVLDAMGVRAANGAQWRANPIILAYTNLALGHQLVGWLCPVAPLPWQLRALVATFGIAARMRGKGWPQPRLVPVTDVGAACEWIVAALSVNRPLVLTTAVSAAVRVSREAFGRGHDLTGLIWHTLGEPCTPTRRALIESSGARVIVDYGTQELPTIALGCAAPIASDDTHVFTDSYAVVTRRRPLEGDASTIDALMVTTLSPHAGKVAVNVETGDSGRLERRNCGCAVGEVGLATHLRDLVSFEKLSSEGMTVAAALLTRIVESELPARFGGAALDYQLIEAEQPDGQARLTLRIAPGVGDVDADEARAWLLERLGTEDELQRRMVDVWRAAGTLSVVREGPLANAGGKVFPFRRLSS
jgi:hypothetical protein